MKIRKATINDLGQVADLFDQYRRWYKKPGDIEGAKEFLGERLKQDDSEIFIAEDDNGKLTGFTQLYPLFSSTRMKRYWLLNDLFVHPDFRSNGISIQLIDQAKQLCKDTKACGMYLETGKDNEIGNNLYPRAGMNAYDSVNFYEWEVEND